MKLQVSLVFLGLLAMAASKAEAGDSSHEGFENFSPAQIQILRTLSDMLLRSEIESELLEQQGGVNYYSPSRMGRPSKRNSELLNSLLGLPKNILKSGRK